MQSIHVQSSEKAQWLLELAQSFSNPFDLLEYLELPKEPFEQAVKARKLFAMRVPRPFAEKMQKGQSNDPLFLQAMVSDSEFLQVDGFVKDPLEEQASPAPNILHKYHNRLLFMIKNSCAINCRYCFRRHFPYEEVKSGKLVWQQGLDYIKTHTELEEVIFSGGDPLMAKDEELAWLLTKLEQISHIKTLRIHTRLPVVIPNRITTDLCERLSQSRLNIVLVTHVNHPNEIDEIFAQKMEQLKRVNVTLLNQSVMLKGVNNEAKVLKTLSDKLFACGILPYYLHLLDKVEGASHFYVSDEQAVEIHKNLQKITSGYLVPKLVREIAKEPNKTLIG